MASKRSTDKAVGKVKKARTAAEAALAEVRGVVDRLGGKSPKKLSAAAAELAALTDVSAKKLAKHPKKRHAGIRAATARLEKRLTKARRKLAADATSRPDAPVTGDASHDRDSASVAVPEAEQPPPSTADGGSSEGDGASLTDAEALAEAQSATLPGLDLSSLTVFELRRRARETGRVGYSSMTKAQLVDLLSS